MKIIYCMEVTHKLVVLHTVTETKHPSFRNSLIPDVKDR